MGPDGPAYGRLMLEFKGGNVTYQQTDWVETVAFTCSNGVIVARGTDHELGRFNAAKRTLVFHGNEYERVE